MANFKNALQRDVIEFHRKFDVDRSDVPVVLSSSRKKQRDMWLMEEAMEAFFAAEFIDQVDALVDVIYIAIGTLVEMGVDLDRAWSAVHAANMRKERGATPTDKIQKPDGWVGPEEGLAKAILQQMQEEDNESEESV